MRKIIIFIVVCLLLTGCSNKDLKLNNSLDNEKNNNFIDEISEEKLYTIVNVTNDYLYIFPKDLYTNAKLVVIGKYVKNGNSYMGPSGSAKTVYMFDVEKVLKGECSKKNISVGIDGGTISLKEYVDSLTSEQIRKQRLENVDTTDKYIRFELVDEVDNEINSNIETGKSYVLFLDNNFNNKADYIVTSNYYSVLELKNNEIYDKKTNNYISVDTIGE